MQTESLVELKAIMIWRVNFKASFIYRTWLEFAIAQFRLKLFNCAYGFMLLIFFCQKSALWWTKANIVSSWSTICSSLMFRLLKNMFIQSVNRIYLVVHTLNWRKFSSFRRKLNQPFLKIYFGFCNIWHFPLVFYLLYCILIMSGFNDQ